MTQSVNRRFEKYISMEPNTGCWLWLGSTDKDGYGMFWTGEQYCGAHRASYLIYVGTIPEGQSVLHRCDTPGCCNPLHLFLGTAFDNVQDCIKKGRRGRPWYDKRGINNPKVRFTEEQILAIRRDTRTQVVIAAEYGTKQSRISEIKLGKSWTHLL